MSPPDTLPEIDLSAVKGLKVFVVDDEPINLQVITNNLVLAGMQVETALSTPPLDNSIVARTSSSVRDKTFDRLHHGKNCE